MGNLLLRVLPNVRMSVQRPRLRRHNHRLWKVYPSNRCTTGRWVPRQASRCCAVESQALLHSSGKERQLLQLLIREPEIAVASPICLRGLAVQLCEQILVQLRLR